MRSTLRAPRRVHVSASILLITLVVMALVFVLTWKLRHAVVAGVCTSSVLMAARRPSGWMLAPAGGLLVVVMSLAGVNGPTCGVMMALVFFLSWVFRRTVVAGICASSVLMATRKPSGWMLAPAGGLLALVLILAVVNGPTHEKYQGRCVPVYVRMMWEGGWNGTSRPDPLSSRIPEHEVINDFMAALIVETYGYRVLAFCLALLTALLALLARRALKAREAASAMLGAGVFSLITAQALVHLAVNFNLVPIRGFPLPFMSHAPSNTAILWILMVYWGLASWYAARCEFQAGSRRSEKVRC